MSPEETAVEEPAAVVEEEAAVDPPPEAVVILDPSPAVQEGTKSTAGKKFERRWHREIIQIEGYLCRVPPPSSSPPPLPQHFHRWAPQAADLLPPPLRVAKTGRNNLKEEFTPPPPHWDRREILAKP